MTNASRSRVARRWVRPLVGAAAAVLVVGACGSGDDGEDAVATSTSVTAFPTIPPITTATTAAPPTTVNPNAGPTFPPPPSTTVAGASPGSTAAGGGSGDAAGTYTVKAGDYLSGIAKKLGVDFNALLEVNGFTSDSLIVPGQKIKVPSGGNGGGGTDTTAAGGGSDTTAAGGATTTAAGGVAGTYTVQANDYLAGIAKKLGVDYNKLLEVNGFTADSVIHPGDKIKVPAS